MASVISAEGLSFTYPGASDPAVDGLDFEVQPGEVFGFLGPSGAGKSTVQKILIRLLQGFRGEVTVRGRPVGQWDASLYEHIGVAFEYPNHFLKLTGLENLAYFARLFRNRGAAPRELLEGVGLAEAADQRVGAYSKGMKTRLSVARALLHAPDLLFFDEPTGGLDPVSARAMKALISEQAQRGRTVFLTTHDMAVAEQLCDRVAFLVGGRIRAIDSPRALMLAHGEPTLRVDHRAQAGLASEEFPMAGLADNGAFLELLRGGRVETMHTQEASLEDVFVRLTGRRLA